MLPPLLVLLLASFQPPASLALAAQPPSCSPKAKACGGLLDISYPFWLGDDDGEPVRRPCGAPSFQLTCNNSSAFLTRSIFRAYRVAAIFSENSSFHVVDENLPLDTGCPAPPFNISLSIGLAPFVISKSNADLLFFSGCDKPPPHGFRRLSCVNTAFVQTTGEVPGGVPPGCAFTVVPVLGAFAGDTDDYVGRMRSGFLLEWKEVSGNCPKCSASGGECTYDDHGLSFACNCSGTMRPGKCG